MNIEAVICNLNGYLQSLRRLSGNKCDFWVDIIEVKTSLEDDVETHIMSIDNNLIIIDKTQISYHAVQEHLDKFVFSNLLIDDENILKLLAWDVVEYYGLASTELDPNGELNPLVHNGAILINIQSQRYESFVYYIVALPGYAIITGIAIRA